MDENPRPCHSLAMSRSGVALVGRRYVDYGRVFSASCPAAD
jgi:hypothetical protein